MTFTIRVIGTKELQKRVKRLGKPFMNEVGERTVKTAEKHLKRIYARKVDTGDLRRSIRGIWKKASLNGFVSIGNESTMRRVGRRAPINYAKFIEEGFRGHHFPIRHAKSGSKKIASRRRDWDRGFTGVSTYGGLHGMEKSAEKTRKELDSIAKKAFDVVVTRR